MIHTEHVTIYRDEGYFAAWPANGGLWQFADGEIAVGFVRGTCDYAKPETVGHIVVDCDRGEHVILRSRDGGHTWPLDSLTTVYRRPELDEYLKTAPAGGQHSEISHDPKADGYCLLSGFGIPPADGRFLSWTMVSTDRGHTWTQAQRLPRGRVSKNPFTMLGGRPNYVVRDDGMMLLFAHGARDGDETRSWPIVYGSTTGGATWGILGEIELRFGHINGIMPYPIILRDGTMLVAVRRQYDTPTAYTEIYRSPDGGREWSYLSRVNDWGAPASLNEMPDGRLICTYGYRRQPYGIRASVSEDAGKTWGPEIVLRDDGGSHDLGYPRTVLLPDGSLFTAYYFNEASDPIQCSGGVRHIAATIWKI